MRRPWLAFSMLSFLLAATESEAASFEKGIGSPDSAYMGSDVSKLQHLNLTWAYNWGVNPPAPMPADVEFVPMLWGAGSVTPGNIAALTAAQAAGTYTHLLGFNEPDLAGQANMTPQEAIALWPQLMSTNLRLGSPAVASPYIASQTDPSKYWIDHFMELADAAGYRVDFITLHHYPDFTNAGSASWVQTWTEDVYARFGLPIWITEIGSYDTGGPSTTQAAGRFMEEVLRRLDSLPYVERVAWFMDNCYSGAGGCDYTSLYNNADVLTNVGQIYKYYPRVPLPGRLEAEDHFNSYDTTGGNAGNSYRLDTNTDIQACTDPVLGFCWNVGWMAAGEWLDFPVTVPASGSYDLSVRYAVAAGTQSLQLSFDGGNLGGPLSLPSTGGNQNWETVVLRNQVLAAGDHALRMTALSGGFNLNYIDVAPHHALPGRIEAEDFSGFYDDGAANNGALYGALYRLQDVDLNVCTDTGGGYNVGWIAAGEWLEYPVELSSAGLHDFEFRVANGSGANATLQMQLDGAPLGPVVNVPATGGWQNWTTVAVDGLSLASGIHTLRVAFTAGSLNFNYLDVLSATVATSTPSATPSPSPTTTATASASASRTASPTRSSTPSPTSSVTPTWTGTVSPTPTVTPTSTPTFTISETPTPTSTASPTTSETPSTTASPSPSSTPSVSLSPTQAPPGSTATATPSASPTLSATPEASSTASSTPTFTPTATPTDSPTGTITPTVSLTASPSLSPTLGASSTSSFTVSPVPTLTQTPSLSSTATATATVSVTETLTATAGLTASATRTRTATPIQTPAQTTTRTPTPLLSLTPSPTPTQSSPATGDGLLLLLQVLPAPNPVTAEGGAAISVELEGVAGQIRVRVYAPSMMLVGEWTAVGPHGPGWSQLQLPNELMAGLSNGLYYLVAIPGKDGSEGRGTTAKLMLLR